MDILLQLLFIFVEFGEDCVAIQDSIKLGLIIHESVGGCFILAAVVIRQLTYFLVFKPTLQNKPFYFQCILFVVLSYQ